jgi:hypothetical protein
MRMLVQNSENYKAYRALILEETEKILSNKKRFLTEGKKDIDRKIDKIENISDFFYLEGEYTIIQELNSILKALQVKRFLKI